MARLDAASVHGRFQPFHNGHLDYVCQAFDRANLVYVGLTQLFQPSSGNAVGLRRDTNEANPLSFFERTQVVTAALTGAGISRARFSVIPFPIETPERLPEFLPLSIRCLTTRLNSWNDQKIERLQHIGYVTELLAVAAPNETTITTGSEIRRLIRAGDRSWRKFVPPAAAQLIEEHYLERF